MSVTFSFERPDNAGTVFVVVKGPDLGNEEMINRGQEVGETLGGQLFVYERGPRRRELRLSFPNLDVAERADLERFFGPDLVGLGRRWITITFTAPTARVILRAGHQVNAAAIQAGSTYKAGQRILPDTVIVKARLTTPELPFNEALQKHHTVRLVFRVLEDFLPSNV